MDKELDKKTTRNLIYGTAPKCPFCGGTMLPLEYCADGEWPWTSIVYRFEDVSGTLKACDNCGIVKFYPDSKE